MSDRVDLALHGSRPVRDRPFPSVDNSGGRTLGAEELAALTHVIESGKLSRVGGTQVSGLEREFAALYGSEYAVASTSGTAALHLAVAAVDPEPGDEIVVPPITDFGTAIGVLSQNAVPIFADVDPLTGCLTAETVEAVLSERTRAVIVVHLFGGPAPVEDIVGLAHRRGITVIEDCAQSYLTVPQGGTTYAGRRGDIGCFSLQQSKHITAGDGGLTLTDDPALARRMRLFADKGWPRDGGDRTHLFLGLNYRMTELQGAVARAQLAKLPQVVGARRSMAGRLVQALENLKGLTLPGPVERHSYWLFPLVVDPKVLGADNSSFAQALAAEGIPARSGYLDRPLYLVPALRDRHTYGRSGFPLTCPPARKEIRYQSHDCPVAENLIAQTLLVLPWNEHYSKADVDDIASAVRKVYHYFRRASA